MEYGFNKIIMLSYFTWKQFGLALGGVLLIYYLIILLLFYRRELAALFSRRRGAENPPAPFPVMGPVREDTSEMSMVSSEDLDFGGEETPAGPDKNKVLLLGGLADLMHELKTLVRITREENETKESFLSLFRLIASNYSQFIDGAFNASIISYLADTDLPFRLSADELEQILNDLNND